MSTTLARSQGTAAMVLKYATIRKEAYDVGLMSYPKHIKNPFFRDFLLVYLCEGYKRSQNMVQVTNSDPTIISLCYPIVKERTKNKMSYFVHIHHDDNEQSVVKFWSELINIDASQIRVYRRPQKITNRKGKLPHGIFTFRVGDTSLRMMIEAWIVSLKKEWSGR